MGHYEHFEDKYGNSTVEDVEKNVRKCRNTLIKWFCRRAILDGEKPEIPLDPILTLPETEAGIQEIYDKRHSIMPGLRPI